jgi:PhnB protein
MCVMAKATKPVPDGYHTVTAYLSLRSATQGLDFYKRAFGAQEVMRMPGADGKGIAHAEIRIGDSIVMLGDESPQGNPAPESLGGTPVSLFLYVDDVDKGFQRAVEAGAKAIMPPADMFWGDRFGKLKDPFGHEWGLATHKEDLSPEEMGKRAQAALAQMPKQS